MEQGQEEYTERLEKNLRESNNELVKQICQNGILKDQITFLIDRIQDMDFVLHGNDARKTDWFEVSQNAVYNSRVYKDYKWGDKVKIKKDGRIGVVYDILPFATYEVKVIIEGDGLKQYSFKYGDIEPIAENEE